MPASFDPNTGVLTFEVGADDDDAGVFVQVAGEAYPRFALTKDGIVTSDGSYDPTGSTGIGDAIFLNADTGVRPGSATSDDLNHFDNDYTEYLTARPQGAGRSFDVNMATGRITILESGLYNHLVVCDMDVAGGTAGQASIIVVDLRDANAVGYPAIPSWENTDGDADCNINQGAETRVHYWAAGTVLKAHFTSAQTPWAVTSMSVAIERIG